MITTYFTAVRLLLILLISALSGGFLCARNQDSDQNSGKHPLTRILFVFDASQSMAGTWESDEKINIAREFLIDVIDSLRYVDNTQMALRVYGHQSAVPPQDCNDTRLEVPFGENNSTEIIARLKSLKPRGTTPIANSLALSANDFPQCGYCRNIIVLITDGIEACDGDPCSVSRELQEKGIVLKPFVLGIGLDPSFRETFDCVGHFYNIRQESNFKQTLGFVINQVLESTTAQVQLLDENDMATETDVNLTFSDQFSKKIMYNYIHHLNEKGSPDSLQLTPLITYKLEVHTLPPVIVDSVEVPPGKHTVIKVKCPQGYLILQTKNGKKNTGLSGRLSDPETGNLINYQPVGNTEKYLTGSYNLEIPTIPPILIKDLKILPRSSTKIEIEEPGRVTFSARFHCVSGLYLLKGDEQIKVANLNPHQLQQYLDLQPGFYRVIYRNKDKHNSLQTSYTNFEVKAGGSIIIDL